MMINGREEVDLKVLIGVIRYCGGRWTYSDGSDSRSRLRKSEAVLEK